MRAYFLPVVRFCQALFWPLRGRRRVGLTSGRL